MDVTALLERMGRIGRLDRGELATLRTDIVGAYAALREDDDRSDETIEALGELADAIDSVKGRQQELDQADRARAERLSVLDRRAQLANGGDGGGDRGDSPTVAQGQGCPDSAPWAVVNPDGSVDSCHAAQADAEDRVAEMGGGNATGETVAASGPVPLQRLAARRPASQGPRVHITRNAPRTPVTVTTPAGVEKNFDDIGGLIAKHLSGPTVYETPVVLASMEAEIPPERRLGGDGRQNDALLASMLERVTSEPEALTAGGGVCGPVAPFYEQLVIANADRPLAAGLPAFGGDRGGVRVTPAPGLSDILVDATGGAVGLVTNAQDVANTQKTAQVVTCGVEQTSLVDATYHALKFGNAQGRFYPERQQAYLKLAMAAHARRAETRLLALIDAGSVTLHTAKIVGAARDLIGAVTRAVSGYRSRERVARDVPLTAIFPSWAIDVFKADLANSWGSPSELFNVTDQQVEGWLRDKGVNPIWSPDRQVFGAQGGGGVLDWPDTCTWNLHHAGQFVHLDGGTLDLGVVRDSNLVADNRYEIFAESFETVFQTTTTRAFVIDSDICTSGLVAGTVDTSGKCTGAAFGS